MHYLLYTNMSIFALRFSWSNTSNLANCHSPSVRSPREKTSAQSLQLWAF